jgi:hypothetical protein
MRKTYTLAHDADAAAMLGKGRSLMRWATRPGCHADRAACAWLIRRFIDPEATFCFVADLAEVPVDVTAFDLPGATLSYSDSECTFEIILGRYGLDDVILRAVAGIVHEADLADEVFDAPEAAGLDVLCRGLAMVCGDDETLSITTRLFDGLYEYHRRSVGATTSQPPAGRAVAERHPVTGFGLGSGPEPRERRHSRAPQCHQPFGHRRRDRAG